MSDHTKNSYYDLYKLVNDLNSELEDFIFDQEGSETIEKNTEYYVDLIQREHKKINE